MATLCHEVMRCTCSVDSPPDTSILTCETLAVNESGIAITTQAFHVGFRMEVMEVQCVLRAELLHGHLRMYAVSSIGSPNPDRLRVQTVLRGRWSVAKNSESAACG